jgi:hypothetical protein
MSSKLVQKLLARKQQLDGAYADFERDADAQAVRPAVTMSLNKRKMPVAATEPATAAASTVPSKKTKTQRTATSTLADASPRKMSVLQNKMQKKLKGAQFRWLNEHLYTVPSQNAFALYQGDPSLFDSYHSGYRAQVQSWPENPLDRMISFCSQRIRSGAPPVGSSSSSTSVAAASAASAAAVWTVGDFGCGEARLAATLTADPHLQRRCVVHSFDLVAANALITACDIAKTPLQACSLDIAIFCLSLMGTNFLSFLREAHRTLKARYKIIRHTLLSHQVSSFDHA